ncbi:uncharacterized protein N0V89_009369 [Didymosphaeria variabile]|uniref:NWD NACHT-NTPase N-terminal domain-containing protein n=1 Tax=Didymosphaeria variabile TaxID=1932322 RepID=A0A9W9C6H6_9PLEO|nr:uncharacterized protein N0V89_009369 [Didymosphaeria variabile]KAJ4347997.1 hypothetical protein N0V89_009369 [Didymosphaeria variabile]
MSTVVSGTTKAGGKRHRDHDLWRSAYKKLKHEPDGKKILEKCHKTMQKESAKKGISIGHLGSSDGRQKLLKLINAHADSMKSHSGTYDKVLSTILKTKDVVSTGAAASPPAAIAVAGIFMVFSIHQDYLREEQAMLDCVTLIARIICRRAVEHKECESRPLESKELKELRQQLKWSYLEMYFKLLLTTAKLVYKLSIPRMQRWADTLVGWTDWTAEIASLEKAEREIVDDLDVIHHYKTNPAAQASPYWRKGRNTLHQNAAIGIESRVAELIETNSFDPNAKTTEEWTALSLAAEGGHLKCCQILLEVRGIDIESQNKDGRTALHIAAMKDRNEVVRALVRKGANLNVKDKDRKTPLHLAAEAGRLRAVEVLCNASGISLDLSDSNGRTALHLASLKKKAPVVKLLSDKGAKIDRKDSKKRTAFLDAADVGSTELLKTLQECGANINQQTLTHKWSALHMCASYGHSKALQALLSFPDINVDIQNTDERTPLHEAVLKNRTKIAQTLCNKGAAVDTRDKKKRTPFLDAAHAGNLDIIKKLKAKGADINQVSGRNKWSALHEAALKGKIELVRWLVNEGIKTDLRVRSGTKKGMTAREMAEQGGKEEVGEFLRMCEERG